MNNEGLDRILKEIQDNYFTDVLALICQLLAISTILISSKKNKFTFLFLFYCISAFLLFFTLKLRFFFYGKNESSTLLVEGENVIFAYIEYIVFYYFFTEIFRIQAIKLFLQLFFVGMTGAIIIFFYEAFFDQISDSTVLEFSDFIISPELLLLGALCLTYYLKLLIKKPALNLRQSPSFWIITGLFFYSLAITPFFMIITTDFIIDHAKIYHILFALHHISFSFLFIAIIKAFLCKKPLTT